MLRYSHNLLTLLAATTILASFIIVVQPVEQARVVEDNIPAEEEQIREAGIQPPELSARGIYAVDLESGKVLYQKNADTPSLPASTTKIATALVSLSYYALDEVLVVGEITAEGQTMELEEGEQITVRDLLYGLLVFSANDAAEVLAANYPGGRQGFVSAMNNLATTLGLEKTNFVNPTGLDEYLHFSTAKDLTSLAVFAMENKTFARIVATEKTNVFSADGEKEHKLVNINQLLGKVPGILGVKTGWTINSGESLVSLVERKGRKVVIALLGSEDRFGETERLIDWLYANYSWVE